MTLAALLSVARVVVAEPPAATRHALDAVLARGLGSFLQGLELQPQTKAGRFEGFRVVRLTAAAPPSLPHWLRVGDVVRAVNGLPVERPEQALRAWQSLRVASSIVVDLEREGRSLQLRVDVAP